MYVLALGWKHAFDSVNTAALLLALKRFGFLPFVLDVVKSVYMERTFMVRDKSSTSDEKDQLSGISQGCPLSPFLFVVTMSVVMHDAEMGLQPARPGQFQQLVYADDTLLMARTAADLQRWLDAMCRSASAVGLDIHWGKLQLLRVRCDGRVRTPTGRDIEATETLSYLGTTVCSDGRAGPELRRRVGMALGEFNKLTVAILAQAISAQTVDHSDPARPAEGLFLGKPLVHSGEAHSKSTSECGGAHGKHTPACVEHRAPRASG